MSRVFDLSETDDDRDVVHQVVEALVGGGVAVLPGQAEYVRVALPENIAKLCGESDPGRIGLLFRSREMAADWLPGLSDLGNRLLSRIGANPVTYSWDSKVAANGAIDSLSASAVELLTGNGRLRGAIFAHRFLGEVLQLLPGPVVFEGLPRDRNPEESNSSDTLLVAAGEPQYPEPPSEVAVDGERWSLEREGCIGRETIARMGAHVTLFVCTGNTCRSPMAAGLFRKLLADRLGCEPDELPSRGHIVESAGISAGYGSPASPEAVSVAGERGFDLTPHVSRPVTEEALTVADRVWAMTAGHLGAIRAGRPELAEQCELLSPSGRDVVDPFGGSRAEYQNCLRGIEELLVERLDDVLSRSPEELHIEKRDSP